MIMDEITRIKRYFDTNHIPLCDDWLNDCVKWCKEEALNPDYTFEDLKYKVFEQWTSLDLRDVEMAVLPPGLSTKTKFLLDQNYTLQMMKVVDISKPKYWQLQRIRGETPKNLDKDETASAKRVLLLTLTDGVQEVEAMEYKTVPSLSLSLTPGVKIKINGPVEIRRGRMMLERKHVKVIGGEVDSLLVENAAENVLARELKLPLNDNPRNVQENVFIANENDTTSAQTQRSEYLPSTNQTRRNLPIPNRNTSNTLTAQNTQNSLPTSRIPTNPTRSTQNTQSTARISTNPPRPNIHRSFEEMRLDEEIDELLEIQHELENEASAPRKSTAVSSNMFEDEFHFNVQPAKIFKRDLKQPVNTCRPNDDLMNSLETENDLFENIDIDAHLDNLDREIKEKELQEKNVNVVTTIERVLKTHSNGKKYKIKAKFKQIIEKLALSNDEYHLVVEVADETGKIVTKIHNDVVASLARCTVEEFIQIKADIQNSVVEAQTKALDVLKKLKQNLQNLNSEMEIEMIAKEKYPVITAIIK